MLDVTETKAESHWDGLEEQWQHQEKDAEIETGRQEACRGRPERRFMDVEKESMKVSGVKEEEFGEEKVKWRQMICCANPTPSPSERKSLVCLI